MRDARSSPPEPASVAHADADAHVGRTVTSSGRTRQVDRPDPLLLALARYVQALDERYPEGPAQMHREDLDGRANMPTVLHPKDPAA
ncbi:hypothetical protein BH23CHL8_BH23CHL8_28850 [soil metagenome]